MTTNISSISNNIKQSVNELFLDVTIGNNSISKKQSVFQINQEHGSVSEFLTELQNRYNETIIVEQFKKNGSSFSRISIDLIPVESGIPKQAPTLGAINQLPVVVEPKVIHSNVSDTYKEKYLYAQELFTEAKKRYDELYNKAQDLYEENRKLKIANDTFEERKRLELMMVEASNKASLNGIINDATKPETLTAIKDIIVAFKGEGQAQPQADTLLSGIADEEAKILIQTVVQLLKTQDKEFISKIMLFIESMISNRTVLDDIINQINNPTPQA